MSTRQERRAKRRRVRAWVRRHRSPRGHYRHGRDLPPLSIGEVVVRFPRGPLSSSPTFPRLQGRRP